VIYARQSTAIIVTVGPVLDADGVAVTGGVVADFKISKNGGAPAALNGSATLTHRHTGFYSLSLTTSDVDTVGTAEVVIDDTVNACPMKEIQVVEPAVYDALYADAAAGYQVPIWANAGSTVNLSATTVATVTTTTTATNLTNLPAITANWLTAAGTAADYVAEMQAGVAAELLAAGFSTVTDIGDEVDTRLEAMRLDELLAADSDIDGAAPPTVGSVFHELMSKTAGSFTFDQTTDSLEANADAIEVVRLVIADDTLNAIALVQTDTTAIVADTNELQTDWADGGRLDLILDARAATGDAMTLADGAITDAKITIPAEASGRPTTALGMLRRIFEWFGNKRIRTRATGVVQLRNAADDGNLVTATQSTAGGAGVEVDTQSAGS
jgi:hypothetical protein